MWGGGGDGIAGRGWVREEGGGGRGEGGKGGKGKGIKVGGREDNSITNPTNFQLTSSSVALCLCRR